MCSAAEVAEVRPSESGRWKPITLYYVILRYLLSADPLRLHVSSSFTLSIIDALSHTLAHDAELITYCPGVQSGRAARLVRERRTYLRIYSFVFMAIRTNEEFHLGAPYRQSERERSRLRGPFAGPARSSAAALCAPLRHYSQYNNKHLCGFLLSCPLFSSIFI